MSKTISMMEIRPFTSSELDELAKLTFAEIWWRFDEFLCFLASKVDESHEEIIPYCSLITTADGQKAYVAKSKSILLASDQILYNCMSGFSNEFNCRYADITRVCGESIWGTQSRHDRFGNYIGERELDYKIPMVEEGVRLFYHVS